MIWSSIDATLRRERVYIGRPLPQGVGADAFVTLVPSRRLQNMRHNVHGRMQYLPQIREMGCRRLSGRLEDY